MNINNKTVIVRGGGDIATGCINALHNSGFKVLVLEVSAPTTIRRLVAVSSAVYKSPFSVEGLTAELISDYQDAELCWSKDKVPVLIDEKAESIKYFKPLILVDAILAKKNLGTVKTMADFTIGVGPGFTAGSDVDVVIETMRGHTLGKIIRKGKAIANTGIPGLIAGHDKDRVIHSQADGTIQVLKDITSKVKKGEVLAIIHSDGNKKNEVKADIDGIVRGMIIDGFPVTKGLKIADIDPRDIEENNCYTISDKARCIGGSVLEAAMNYIKSLY